MMKCTKFMLVAVATLIVFSVATANSTFADSPAYKNYGRIAAGANVPTGGLDDEGYDSGVNITASYGRYLWKNLAVEGTLGTFFSEQDFNGTTAVTGNYDREDLVSASSILGTIKGEIPVGPVTLFAGGGVGFYIVTLSSEIDTARFGELEADDSDSVFGAHATVGGYFNITPRAFVGFEGAYRWTTDYDLNDRVGTIPVRLEGDLNGYALNITCGLRF